MSTRPYTTPDPRRTASRQFTTRDVPATFSPHDTQPTRARRRSPGSGPAAGGDPGRVPDTTPFPAGGIQADMTEYTTVSIPKDLADRVEETIEGTSFSSTSDLVRFLLRSIVIKHQQEGELTEAEFSEIADQLRDLGYLE